MKTHGICFLILITTTLIIHSAHQNPTASSPIKIQSKKISKKDKQLIHTIATATKNQNQQVTNDYPIGNTTECSDDDNDIFGKMTPEQFILLELEQPQQDNPAEILQ